MGSASSKIPKNARPLPAATPHRAAPRSVDPGPLRNLGGSGVKSEQVLSESKDPDLDKMLQTIGQVSVPKSATDMGKHESMVNVLRRRAELDDAAFSPSTTVSVGELAALLDARKASGPQSAGSREGDLDPKILDVLARYVSSPGVRPVRDPDPTKPPRHMAVWTSTPASGPAGTSTPRKS